MNGVNKKEEPSLLAYIETSPPTNSSRANSPRTINIPSDKREERKKKKRKERKKKKILRSRQQHRKKERKEEYSFRVPII